MTFVSSELVRARVNFAKVVSQEAYDQWELLMSAEMIYKYDSKEIFRSRFAKVVHTLKEL